LYWSWTGGRCPILHLTTYKAEREEKDPQSILHNSKRRQMLVERLHDRGAGSQIIYTFSHYLIVCYLNHINMI
jgi:hypothetical protein